MPTRRHLLFLIVLLWMFGCREKIVSPQASVGEHTLKLTAITHDEFDRPTTTPGATSIILVGDDRTVRTSIPDGTSSYEFHGLPSNSYILSAQKDGYYPAEITAGAMRGISDWSPMLHLYPHPSPLFRIDSIWIDSNPSSKSVMIRLVTAQTAPASYMWRAAVFFSRSSPIDPSKGTYDFNFQASGWGNVIINSYANSYFPVPPGTRLYVTARLMTSATEIFPLQTWQKGRFSNLEENSTAVSSFVLQ